MEDIPIAPVVPIPAGAAPLAIPTAEAYIPPVSMFDLIPGRRYIITNRRVNALHVRNQHQHNSYAERTHSFIGTFLYLTKPKGQYNYNSYHPMNFFKDLERERDDETELTSISDFTRSPLFRDSSLLMNQNDVYPIFHYEQGLTEAQLQDLTLQAEFNWIRGDLYQGGRRVSDESPGAKLIKDFNGRIMPALTGEHTHYAPETIQSWREQVFNKIPQEPIPGLLYYGYDEHSNLYKGYSRWGGHMSNTAYTEERNFKYSMVKQWKTQWYTQNPNYSRNYGFRGGLPQAAKDAGYTSFAETYFNQPELLSNNGRIGLTQIQSQLLRYNLMIVFPRYWSFTYNPEHQDDLTPGEAEILADRIRRGAIPARAIGRPRRERAARRALDGGGRRKKTKRRKRKKTKKKKKKKN